MIAFKSYTLSKLKSKKLFFLGFWLGVFLLIQDFYYKIPIQPIVQILIIVSFIRIFRLPYCRNLFDLSVSRLWLLMKTLTNQNRIREYLSLPQRSRLLYSCFTIDIAYSPTSISGFIDSELFQILIEYLNRFGVEATLMSVVFYRDNTQKWRIQVLYTFRLDNNYNMVMAKQSNTPFYSTGKAQLERLQNELNQLNYRSKVVDTSLSVISREVFENWKYVSDRRGIKFSSYIVRPNKNPITTLDTVFNRPRTGHIVLHCEHSAPHRINVLGIVTIQGKRRSRLEGKINAKKSFFTFPNLLLDSGQERIPGLHLCRGEQGKALYAYHPLYIVTEIPDEQRNYALIDLQKKYHFDAFNGVRSKTIAVRAPSETETVNMASATLYEEPKTEVIHNGGSSHAVSS